MPKPTKVNIVDDPEGPVIERNVLAKDIIAMSKALKQLHRGGLTRRAIVLLTNDNIKPSHRPGTSTVELVLNSLETLAKTYAVETKTGQ